MSSVHVALDELVVLIKLLFCHLLIKIIPILLMQTFSNIIATNLQEIFQGQVYAGHLENLTPINIIKTIQQNFNLQKSLVMK